MKKGVILVNNQKGGVGKTTTAVNLAVGLAYALKKSSSRVLLIDTDPQGCVSTALGIAPSGCLSQLLTSQDEIAYSEVIVSVDAYSAADAPRRPNLYVLPATEKLSAALDKMNQDYGAMQELAGKLSAGARRSMGVTSIPTISDTFESVIGPLRDKFPYIVIDSPPTVGPLTEALFRFSDFVIVPTEVDYHSVTQTLKHTYGIQSWQGLGAKVRLLAVVPTMYQGNLTLTNEMSTDLNIYGRLLADAIPRRTAIAQAPAYGMTVLEYQPRSDGARAYASLVKRVLEA